jgi:hypothetical protein
MTVYLLGAVSFRAHYFQNRKKTQMFVHDSSKSPRPQISWTVDKQFDNEHEFKEYAMDICEEISAAGKGLEHYLDNGWGDYKSFLVARKRFDKLRSEGIL